MTSSRLAVFLTIVLSIWTAMHAYVFWRLATVPWIANHLNRRTLLGIAIGLWTTYPLARFLFVWHLPAPARALEHLGATWIGVLFLLFAVLLVTDVVTLWGLAIPRWAPEVRSWAVIAAGLLSTLSLVQGLRPPVVREYEVTLPNLPRERDGMTLVEISDLHLGTMLGERWLRKLVERVNELRPDAILVVGDVVDANVSMVEPMLPVLKELHAPLGVFAVTGNHEYYAGLDQSLQLFQAAGFAVLRDGWREICPGLVLAGVDDLTARREFGQRGDVVVKALQNRPDGATILLSHSPQEAKQAAASGVKLMLSGHTHNGQIWPFVYLVRMRYQYVGGAYHVGQMPLIVSRGTGTWGPRMRLWHRSELLRITLRSPARPAT